MSDERQFTRRTGFKIAGASLLAALTAGCKTLEERTRQAVRVVATVRDRMQDPVQELFAHVPGLQETYPGLNITFTPRDVVFSLGEENQYGSFEEVRWSGEAPKKRIFTRAGEILADPDRRMEEGVYSLRYSDGDGHIRDLAFVRPDAPQQMQHSGSIPEFVRDHFINQEYAELLGHPRDARVIGTFQGYTVLQTRFSFFTRGMMIPDGDDHLDWVERDPVHLYPLLAGKSPEEVVRFYSDGGEILTSDDVSIGNTLFRVHALNPDHIAHAQDIANRIAATRPEGIDQEQFRALTTYQPDWKDGYNMFQLLRWGLDFQGHTALRELVHDHIQVVHHDTFTHYATPAEDLFKPLLDGVEKKPEWDCMGVALADKLLYSAAPDDAGFPVLMQMVSSPRQDGKQKMHAYSQVYFPEENAFVVYHLTRSRSGKPVNAIVMADTRKICNFGETYPHMMGTIASVTPPELVLRK